MGYLAPCYYSKQMKVKAQICDGSFLNTHTQAVVYVYISWRERGRKEKERERLRQSVKRDVWFGAKIASEISQNQSKTENARQHSSVCACVCVCVLVVAPSSPTWPTHTHRMRARKRESQRGAHRAIAGAVEFEFAAQILCERKYFYLVNVIYYLCLFEHLSSAA